MINLEKGQRISLTKEVPSLKKIMAGLGWDVNDSGSGSSFDLDVEAFLLKKSGNELVYYGNLKNIDESVIHQGDNLTGEGNGDDEQILLDLEKLAKKGEDIQVIFTVTIYQATEKQQNFGQVNNAYIRLVNQDTNKDICRYDLSEDFSTSKSLIVAKVYNHNGEWKTEAIGKGETGELKDLVEKYNVH